MHQVTRPSDGRSSSLALLLAVLLACGLLFVAGCGSAGPETTVTTATPTTAAPITSTSEAATTTSLAKLDKLTLVAPPGPMAIPMAYLKVNNKLAGVADETDLVIWENPDQLKAIVAGKQGDFVTVPSNTAAIFYNKGLPLQLLDISVWNITYLVTRDPAAADFTDIKGQSLVVPFQGSVPDVTFQYIVKKEGLDPVKDFKLRYAADPTQAAQLLVSGQVDNAVLSEALATAVVLQTKDAEKPLRKVLAFDKAWETAAGPGATSPIAGTVATPNVLGRPDVDRRLPARIRGRRRVDAGQPRGGRPVGGDRTARSGTQSPGDDRRAQGHHLEVHPRSRGQGQSGRLLHGADGVVTRGHRRETAR